jgi:hypothetical protein
LGEWIERIRKAPPLGRGEPTQRELNPQTAKARPAGTRVGRCCTLPAISRQRRLRSQVDWILERCLSGVFALLFSHVQRLEARFAQAATGWHTGCTARQDRKIPQEEDLASIDTVLRLYGRLLCFGATLGRLSHGKPVDPHKGAHRLYPSSGICCPRPPAKPLRRLAERVSLLGRMPCAERNGYRQATRLHLSVDVTAAGKGCGSVQLWGSVSM